MRIYLTILVLIHALFTLSGCASPTLKQVEVPVPVACLKPGQVPHAPKTLGTKELLALDRYERTARLFDQWVLLKADDEALRALIQACTGGK